MTVSPDHQKVNFGLFPNRRRLVKAAYFDLNSIDGERQDPYRVKAEICSIRTSLVLAENPTIYFGFTALRRCQPNFSNHEYVVGAGVEKYVNVTEAIEKDRLTQLKKLLGFVCLRPLPRIT